MSLFSPSRRRPAQRACATQIGVRRHGNIRATDTGLAVRRVPGVADVRDDHRTAESTPAPGPRPSAACHRAPRRAAGRLDVHGQFVGGALHAAVVPVPAVHRSRFSRARLAAPAPPGRGGQAGRQVRDVALGPVVVAVLARRQHPVGPSHRRLAVGRWRSGRGVRLPVVRLPVVRLFVVRLRFHSNSRLNRFVSALNSAAFSSSSTISTQSAVSLHGPHDIVRASRVRRDFRHEDRPAITEPSHRVMLTSYSRRSLWKRSRAEGYISPAPPPKFEFLSLCN